MARSALCAVLLGLALAGGPGARAVDGFGAELGTGKDTRMARLTARWDWNRQWPVGRNWVASAHLEAGLGNWQGRRATGKDLWELGLTPVLRLDSRHGDFYWEGGIGVHLTSHDRIDDRRIFGSRFTFGDHVGFGWRLGDKGRYELGYRFQHLSNAGTAMPNDAINFNQLRLGILY